MPLSSFSSSYSSISVSVEKGALLKAGCTWKRDVRNTSLSPTSEGHGRLQIPTLCSWVHGLLRTFSSIWCTNVQWLKTIFSNYSGVWGGSWSLWPPPRDFSCVDGLNNFIQQRSGESVLLFTGNRSWDEHTICEVLHLLRATIQHCREESHDKEEKIKKLKKDLQKKETELEKLSIGRVQIKEDYLRNGKKRKRFLSSGEGVKKVPCHVEF